MAYALEIQRPEGWTRVRGGNGREMRWEDDAYVSAERYAQRAYRGHLWRIVEAPEVPDEQMSMLELMDESDRERVRRARRSA